MCLHRQKDQLPKGGRRERRSGTEYLALNDDLDTPLKQFVVAHANIVRHCRAIHDAVMSKPA